MAHALSRREFMVLCGAGTLGVVATNSPLPARQASSGPPMSLPGSGDAFEQRAHQVLVAYDAQGVHRTGTDADRASGEWLREQAARSGGSARLSPFELNRLDVQEAFVEVGGQRIDGLPFFDGGVTSAAGISAAVGPAGIQLAAADPSTIATEGEFLAEARRAGRAQAIVVLTSGPLPGLIPSNARRFAEPYGCPVLQVPEEARAALEAAAAAGQVVRVVCHATRMPATAVNVLAEVPGRDPSLSPVVVITPRSGWWHCASERGGGLACWLEALRAVAGARPARRVIGVASTGHELGHLGLEGFLHAESGLVKGARAWIHLGANIGAGAPGARIAGVRLQASDDELDARMSAALDAAGAAIADRLPRGQVPRGEARNLHVGGARYVSLLGQANRWFHHPEDRYPATVSAATVARYGHAVASVVIDLAQA